MYSRRHWVAVDHCRLLSHPARSQILHKLRREEAHVCHLLSELDRPHTCASHPLRLVREADHLESDRDGPNLIYKLTDDRVVRLPAEMLGDAGPLPRPRICLCPGRTDDGRREEPTSGG